MVPGGVVGRAPAPAPSGARMPVTPTCRAGRPALPRRGGQTRPCTTTWRYGACGMALASIIEKNGKHAIPLRGFQVERACLHCPHRIHHAKSLAMIERRSFTSLGRERQLAGRPASFLRGYRNPRRTGTARAPCGHGTTTRSPRARARRRSCTPTWRSSPTCVKAP